MARFPLSCLSSVIPQTDLTPPPDDDFLVGQADMLVEQVTDMETKIVRFHFEENENQKVQF